MTKANRISGYLLIGTGILHNLVGIVLGSSSLQAIVQAGGWNAVEPHWDRMAIVWFLFSGFGIMMWGQLLLSMSFVPRGFAWSLLLLSAVGVFLMPVSGFWLVFPQGAYMLWSSPPQTTKTHAAGDPLKGESTPSGGQDRDQRGRKA